MNYEVFYKKAIEMMEDESDTNFRRLVIGLSSREWGTVRDRLADAMVQSDQEKDAAIFLLKETLGKFVKRDPGDEGAYAETPTSMEEIRRAYEVLISTPEQNVVAILVRGMRLLMKDRLLSNFAVSRIEHLANRYEKGIDT
jgi:hypothetical protein